MNDSIKTNVNDVVNYSSDVQFYLAKLYCDADHSFAALVTKALQENVDEYIFIDTMNSGDSTEYEFGSKYGTATYQYKFDENGRLDKIIISPEDETLTDWTVNVTPEMISLYKKIMLINHVIDDIGRNELLTDEELQIYDNWHESF